MSKSDRFQNSRFHVNKIICHTTFAFEFLPQNLKSWSSHSEKRFSESSNLDRPFVDLAPTSLERQDGTFTKVVITLYVFRVSKKPQSFGKTEKCFLSYEKMLLKKKSSYEAQGSISGRFLGTS